MHNQEKPNLILHLGTENTGTTAIQGFLRINSQKYLKKNIIIPDFLGWNNHSILPCIFYSEGRNDEMTLSHGICDPILRAEKKREIISKLKKLTEKHSRGLFIISSEHLQSRLSDSEVKNLADSLYSMFNSIRLIIYFRKPIDLSISHLSTIIKWNNHLRCELPPPESPYIVKLCSHKQTVECWGRVFGSSNLSARLYEKSKLIDNDVVQDFLVTSGIRSGFGYEKPTLTNPRLNVIGMKLMCEVNKRLPRIINGNFNPRHVGLVSYFEEFFSGPPLFIPSWQDQISYHKYFLESDNFIRDRYFEDLDSIWYKDLDCAIKNRIRFRFVRKFLVAIKLHFWRRLIHPDRALLDIKEGILVNLLLELIIKSWGDSRERILHLESKINSKNIEIAALKNQIKSNDIHSW